jgi:thiamine-phosphate pyrophosphorylase
MKPIEHCQLYGFVDTTYLHGRIPERLAAQLCAGGCDLIQLRAKTFTTAEVERLAERILAVTEKAGVGLVINDYPDVADRVGAALFHLGQEDFASAGYRLTSELRVKYRRSVGKDAEPLQIGLSTHAPDQAQQAIAAGADYIAIGPVHATGTKPTAKPVGLEYVRWASRHVSVPWFAIGGITLANVDAVIEAGARRICVVSAILNAPDVAKACQQFKDRLRSAVSDSKPPLI